MKRSTARLLLKLYSFANALLLTFQPFFLVPVVLLAPASVQAETPLAQEHIDLQFDAGAHEFELNVKTESALPYTITYADEAADPVV